MIRRIDYLYASLACAIIGLYALCLIGCQSQRDPRDPAVLHPAPVSYPQPR